MKDDSYPLARTETRARSLWRTALAVVVLAWVSSASAGEHTGEQAALHVLNRLGYGPRPGDIERVRQMGVDRYLDEQLHPETISLPTDLQRTLAALSTRQIPAGELISQFRGAGKSQDQEEAKSRRRELARQVTADNSAARLNRALTSPRQLEEVMVDFWFNHFNVFAGKGLDVVLVGDYEEKAIRPYVLGRFRDLLGATARHPAMLFYLDNWLSAAPGSEPLFARGGNAAKTTGLNENYARELMELHTLGVDGGYSQKDVTELARMFTGWTFAPGEMMRGGAAFRFDGRRHDAGDKEWLGRHVASRGQAEGEWALDVLASHPATARHISMKLAQYFVADNPPAALVESLSRRFLDTRGDIRAVLTTLFQSREFWDTAQMESKFKTPYHFVISATRAADLKVTNVGPFLGVLYQLGMPLYGCPTPDGYKNTENAWVNAEAMTRRLNFATALASGRLQLTRPRDMEIAKGMGKRQLERLAEPDPNSQWTTAPVDASALQATLGMQISTRTRQTVASAEPALRAALILGSPDFMRR
jgi:uncharacterized protein (DUF1800 family)